MLQETLLDNSIPAEETKTQIVFPLSGFSGKRVMAELWDDSAQVFVLFEESIGPAELVIENVNPNHWYWLNIKEYDDEIGDWVSVHTTWFFG